jgi:hypothetical protein
MENSSELIMYTDSDGVARIEARLQDENVWLTQAQLQELFQKGKSTISEHLTSIFDSGELDENSVVRKFRTTAADGKQYNTNYYSLDVIIALGYRVHSNRGTQFRKWATSILHEYIQKGFAMNDDQMKRLGGGVYWQELRDRFRDIRSSEKVFWRQVLDIFSTSVDYDPKSDEAILFFKKVQNKLHFAVHGNTAAEVIYERADSSQDFMGLTTFRGDLPTKDEVIIAKNYLTENELKDLNRLVSGYLEFAESRAERHIPMYMSDWSEHIDSILSVDDRAVLTHSGRISHEQAADKATDEYNKFRERIVYELTPVEKHFLENLKRAEGLLELAQNGEGV